MAGSSILITLNYSQLPPYILVKFKILTVGKTRAKHWLAPEAEFMQRIGRYTAIREAFVKEADQSLKNEPLIKETEAKSLREKMNADEVVIALDRRGKQVTSRALARQFEDWALHGNNKVTFVIGGPLGLAPGILERANWVLSLSRMTFPHELAKVVLLEQIYRALTIMRGEKYHK